MAAFVRACLLIIIPIVYAATPTTIIHLPTIVRLLNNSQCPPPSSNCAIMHHHRSIVYGAGANRVDEQLSISRFDGMHSAVIVIVDNINGSMVLVAFVDRMQSSIDCDMINGSYIANQSACVYWAKRQCGDVDWCYSIDFIPRIASIGIHRRHRRRHVSLRCLSIIGFAHCPTTGAHRIGVDNRRRLNNHIDSNCPLFQRCDQSLIIDSLVDDRDALNDITSALASVGFDRQLVFDHHRPAASSVTSWINTTTVLPPTKSLIRHAIRSMCRRRFCLIDSLVLVIRTDALDNGDLLLNSDPMRQISTVNDVYKAKELLEDVYKCRAAHVTLLINSPNADRLMAPIRKWLLSSSTTSYPQIRVYIVAPDKYRIWTKADLHSRCMHDIFQYSSTANIDNIADRTIYGAQCNGDLSVDQLRDQMGCQNVPTHEYFAASSRKPHLFDGL